MAGADCGARVVLPSWHIMLALGLALGGLVGLSLGLLGGGGSILTVPIFVYVLGFEAKPAIAMSLLVVGVTSVFGAATHFRSGNVKLRTALLFGPMAMVGAYGGARLAAFVSDRVQLLVLAVVMLTAAVMMARRGSPGGETARSGSGALVLTAVVAVGVGALTGLVGIGGGFLFVPALVVFSRLSMKEAVGTSLVVIAMNAAAGALGYLGRVEIRWPFTAAFAAVAIGGILVGARLARVVPQQALRRGFALLLLIVGVLILYENRAVLS